MSRPSTLLFLPGALGRTEAWQPVADALAFTAQHVHLSWPGFGGTAPDASIRGIDDLAGRVAAAIDRPSALLAQSMGGVVAVLAALQRPELVTHLVLSATSGGMDLAPLGAQDWRPMVRASHPDLPDWFLRSTDDLTARLPALRMPVLLLWGDADPISPVAAGERLQALLPDARLHVLAGAGHDLVETRAAEVARLVDAHLAPG
ncbi:alpha/beta fold hydrolase [uncultured Massilia sp.]|uniref:alpha/beta fold hydrolase n=1 Tax=uncultured Massilia sp. TaxID=169973 RepID=UPI0025FC1450|nr:alpha/beta fold hydrolase [uncultured Massilia sp.]